eukprot:10317382-Lingulodinium_polyedra.AAC.1
MKSQQPVCLLARLAHRPQGPRSNERTAKRLRQKGEQAPEETAAAWQKEQSHIYSQYLRIAAVFYIRVPRDYF